MRIASPRSDTAPSDPGVVGTPARRATRFASILSPIRRITSALGPMNVTSPFSHSSANAAFSDTNPYPGWIASAPKATAALTRRSWSR